MNKPSLSHHHGKGFCINIFSDLDKNDHIQLEYLIQVSFYFNIWCKN